MFISCNRGDSEVNFRLVYEQDFTIDGAVGANFPFNLESPPIASRIQSALQQNNTSEDLMIETTIDVVEIELNSPEGENFSFLETIEVIMEVEDMNAVRLGFLDPVPSESGDIIALRTTSRNLNEHIIADEFVLRLRTITDEFLIEDHELTVRAEFLIKANVFN